MTTFTYTMMAALLRETESQHALAEKRLPKHDWQDWYGAFMVERMSGESVTREVAAKNACQYINREYAVMTPQTSEEIAARIAKETGI